MQLVSYPHEAEWTPFQTHYFSETVAPGIEPGTSGCVARNYRGGPSNVIEASLVLCFVSL
jgi:hypothetical protein